MLITIHNIPQKNGIVHKVHLKFNVSVKVILENLELQALVSVSNMHEKINKILF